MAHNIVSVEHRPATDSGALDGWWAVCSCGSEVSHSLSASSAAKLGDDHAKFMNRKAAR